VYLNVLSNLETINSTAINVVSHFQRAAKICTQ
jgi:hypothetical protein